MKLMDLVGTHIFSGIETGTRKDCRYVKFILDGVTYMALENPADGYRSYMEDLEVVDEPCKTKLPDIPVYCKHCSDDGWGMESDILDFYDETNNERFLTIGTEHTDDYYPYCVFEYKPENLAVNANKEEK